MKKSVFILFLILLSGVVASAKAVPPVCNASFTYAIDSANQHIVHFQSTSTPAGSLTYYWSFGNSTYSTTTNPTVTYTTSGSYTVCLYISNGSGCTDTACAVITVPNSTSCTAYFYATASTSNSLEINFHDYSTPAPTSWYWTFGDSTTSTLQNPSHIYAQAGTYTICLHITTSTGCINHYCRTVVVVAPAPCHAAFTYYTDSLNPHIIHFHSTSTGPGTLTYFWNFGNSTYSTSSSPSVTYSQGGTYTVCLSISNGSNCTDTVCALITVTNSTSCTAYFYATASTSNSLEINFHDYSTPVPSSWYWTFGDSTTSTLQNPSHIYAQAGTYTICLHITTSTGCINHYCRTVVVVAPQPCTNYITFYNQLLFFYFIGHAGGGTAPYSYSWTFGDGGSSNLQNPTHSYATAGTYIVTLTTTDANGCIFTSGITVTASTGPVTYDLYGIVYAGTANLLDHGVAILYACIGSNAYTGLDTVNIDTSGYYHFSAVPTGSYYIRAFPTPVSVYYGQYLPTYYPHNTYWTNATPVILGTPSNPYNIVLEHVQNPLPGAGSISGSIISGAKNSASGIPAPGVEILLQNDAGVPEISMFSDNQGSFAFTGLDYGTYQVYAEVTGLPTYPAIVTLSGANPSINNVSLIITTTEVTAGIQEINLSEQILFTQMYPNPALDEARIDIRSDRSQKLIIGLYNLTGQVVYSATRELGKGNNNLTFNTQNLKTGIYQARFIMQDGSLVLRKLSIIR